MVSRSSLLLSLVLFLACLASADKKKDSLPAEVLDARTVVVLIDPEAGVLTSAPQANKTAQEDVEKALEKWGRLKPVLIGNTADLVITVRRGNGKIVQPTVGGEPPNDRPVVVQPSDSGIQVGVQEGRPPDSMQSPPQETRPRLGSEIGPTEDTKIRSWFTWAAQEVPRSTAPRMALRRQKCAALAGCPRRRGIPQGHRGRIEEAEEQVVVFGSRLQQVREQRDW
jgi:hypothetical protein